MAAKLFQFGLLGSLALLGCGCGPSPPPEFRMNEVEWVKQEKLLSGEDAKLPPEYRPQVGNLVTALFGTPDTPMFPHFLDEASEEIISLEKLQMAAGAVKSDREGTPSGLYREHCSHCHGITGDGAGPTAAFLNPYPRDFRLGKFKFKSTPLKSPPTDEDLVTIMRNGIPGTAMPSFRTLDPKEMEAIIHYVKYLTIRGEYEKRLIAELSSLDGETLLKASDAVGDEEEQAEFSEALEYLISEFLIEDEILGRWFDTDENITEVPSAPNEFSTSDPDHLDLVMKGKDLFSGKANCAQCHGETGMGDGQTENFDAWVNDWVKSPGVDPYDAATYREFMTAGAFPPRPIRPRNLRVPVFRGGGHADELYRRIANGIEGTPMPSSPSLTPDEIWALVAYVKAMPYEKNGIKQPHQPVNQEPVR